MIVFTIEHQLELWGGPMPQWFWTFQDYSIVLIYLIRITQMCVY